MGRREKLFGRLFKRSPSPSPSPTPLPPVSKTSAKPIPDNDNIKNSPQSGSPKTTTPQASVPKVSEAAQPTTQPTDTVKNPVEADTRPLESKTESLNLNDNTNQSTTPAPTIEPATSRNLSEEAFNALPVETQTEVRKLIPEAGTTQFTAPVPEQIKALVQAVSTKQDEYEKKFWKINILGQDIVIRDYVNATLSILEQVGDVAIQFAPAPGSIVWSAVKTLMQMHVAGEAELCVLLMVAQKVTPILCRVQAYEKVFTARNTKKDLLETLESVSIEVYSTCYQIIAHTSRELASTLRRVRHALLKPGQTTDMISSLEKLESEHDKAVNLCHKSSVSESNQRVEGALTQLRESLSNTEKSLMKVQIGVDRLVATDNLEELEWISNVQFTDDHNIIKDKRAEHTGTWLPTCNSFREWESAESSTMFWLEGTVGTGKSVLSSSVIEHLLGALKTSLEDSGFAFFYCNQQLPDHREHLPILRSFVRQLSTTYRSQDHMREELHTACSEAKRRGAHFTMDTCRKQLFASVNLYPQTVIIIDGLDECDQKERKALLNVIDDLMTKCENPVKVYIASRPLHDLQKRFDIHKERNIKIGTSDNLEDIKTFVNQAIADNENWDDEEVSPETKKLVIERLLGDVLDSPPMFRWVDLQLKQLFECRSESDITARLGRLPPDLDKSYDEIYLRNARNFPGEQDRAHADRAFLWVMCALRQLTSNELLAATRLTTIGTMDGKVTEKTLLDLCQHLLVIDPKSGTWRFPHTSVMEYFQRHHWTLAEANSHVAKVCLSQLSVLYTRLGPEDLRKNRETQENSEPNMSEHRIQQYMREHWPLHVRNHENEEPGHLDPELMRLLKAFLGNPVDSSTVYQRWLTHVNLGITFYASTPISSMGEQELEPPNLAILAMARFSLVSSLADWWEETDISVENSDGWNLYAIARSTKVCEVLYRRGLDVNRPMSDPGNALMAAVMRDDVDVAKFLVTTAGADAGLAVENGTHYNALQAAIWRRNIELVKTFVEDGRADINMQFGTRQNSSALITAISFSQLEMLRYLIHEAKADVNMTVENGLYGTALIAAMLHAELKVVEFLVKEAGADMNKVTRYGAGGSALAMAASTGHLDHLKFLVGKGADVNLQLNDEYGSALAAAASCGIDPVKYLVEEGKADVNMRLQKGKYADALAAAAASFDLSIVQYLVEEAGAEIVIQTEEENETLSDPITAAKEFDDMAMIEYLEQRLKGSTDEDQKANEPDRETFESDSYTDSDVDGEQQAEDEDKERNQGQAKDSDDAETKKEATR